MGDHALALHTVQAEIGIAEALLEVIEHRQQLLGSPPPISIDPLHGMGSGFREQAFDRRLRQVISVPKKPAPK